MKVAFRSDTGRKRTNNEDSVYVDSDSGIFILADGMGGHRGGEVAGKIAVREAFNCVKEGIPKLNGSFSCPELLVNAVGAANDAVKEAAIQDSSLSGMGTTLLLSAIVAGKVHICNVGDSRAYLVGESVRQLTKDQTVGAFLLEHNLMDREEIDPGHFHVLIQAVGTAGELKPELIEMNVAKDDILLLCSDGLTDMLSDDEIEAIWAQCSGDVGSMAESLVNAANDNGGYDNISVIIVKFE